MAKPVKGFMSDDGMFFDTKPKAVMHDAEMTLRASCASRMDRTGLIVPVNADSFLSIIENLSDHVQDYLNARKEVYQNSIRTVNRTPENTGGADRHPPDDGSGD